MNNTYAFGGSFTFLPTDRAKQKMQKSHQANEPRQIRNENKHDRKDGRPANIGFVKWRLQCFYVNLEQGSGSFFLLNICVKNLPLRQVTNR